MTYAINSVKPDRADQRHSRPPTLLDTIPGDKHDRVIRALRAALREHGNNADDTIAAFMLTLRRRLDQRPDPHLQAIYAAILADRAYGHALIAWARLSAVERARRRALVQPARRYRPDDRPPTDRQLAYLADLGFGGVARTRREAWDIIEEYRRERCGGRR